MDALSPPGTYAQRLASQRRMPLIPADEIAAVEIDLHTRLRHHPGHCNLLKVKGIGPKAAGSASAIQVDPALAAGHLSRHQIGGRAHAAAV